MLQRVDVEAEAERCGSEWVGRRGRLRVTLEEGPAVVRGDRILVRLRVRPLAMPRNPTDADPWDLARRYQWAARGQVRSHHVLVEHGQGWVAALDRRRQATASLYEQSLSPESAPLAKALGVGDQGGISLAQRDRWATAGTAHLYSVSGLHVALIVMLAYAALRFLLGSIPGLSERISAPRLAAVAALPVLAAFCVWTGAPVPAIRAAVMAGAYLTGIALGRPSSGLNALALAGAGLVLVDPTSLYDLSFLLSFAAVAALLWAPRLPPSRNLAERLRRVAFGSLIASTAATLVTAPITAYHFGQISLAAPLVNLVAVPLGAAVATPL
ncbi:MAG: ComEC/Rec2 family competence protein, partial [Deltaproteobacteria bacterium]|nr:ComEC/Rec2 family competence protein [Deltaproteobacteria bacterium]